MKILTEFDVHDVAKNVTSGQTLNRPHVKSDSDKSHSNKSMFRSLTKLFFAFFIATCLQLYNYAVIMSCVLACPFSNSIYREETK